MTPKPSIILGVTGSISAYKTPLLVRALIADGISVQPIMTRSSHAFVTEGSLGVAAGTTVLTDTTAITQIAHLAAGKTADALLVAPASANSIAKFANGLADDVLSATFLAFRGPKIVAPAMHTEMMDSPAVQRNLAQLAADGVWIVGPATGPLASGDFGLGRLVEISTLQIAMAVRLLARPSFRGRSILVTAGGTREAIDGVRFISNGSTGDMGLTLATLAALLGAKVRVISTVPVADSGLFDAVIPVVSVGDLAAALRDHIAWSDTLIMAAAVSDFTVDLPEPTSKLKRGTLTTLPLQSTPDLLTALMPQKGNRTFVGFSLGDEDVAAEARRKLTSKGLDMVVANPVASIGAAFRSATLFKKTGSPISLSPRTVPEMAVAILSHV